MSPAVNRGGGNVLRCRPGFFHDSEDGGHAMWQRWVSTEWRSEGFSDFAYEVRPTGSTTTTDGVKLIEVGGHYHKADDYHPTRKAALQANYEELRQRYITLQRQCEALLQEIEKEGDA